MQEHTYVLGTHDEEIERLGLQHRVWRSRVLDAWHRAGIAPGAVALDVGCGPGYATLDLAEVVGTTGRVVAIDRSRRFLDRVDRERRAHGWTHVEIEQRDLAVDGPPHVDADIAWCRWIFAFVRQPQALLARVHDALRPGGRLVVHEYFDYATWRMLPPEPALETFVQAVIESWRADGGEPDIGRQLPSWMMTLGMRIDTIRPLIAIAAPGDDMWEWPAAFFRGGLRRLVALGRVSPPDADALLAAFDGAQSAPAVRMATPAVLEIIATRV